MDGWKDGRMEGWMERGGKDGGVVDGRGECGLVGWVLGLALHSHSDRISLTIVPLALHPPSLHPHPHSLLVSVPIHAHPHSLTLSACSGCLSVVGWMGVLVGLGLSGCMVGCTPSNCLVTRSMALGLVAGEDGCVCGLAGACVW